MAKGTLAVADLLATTNNATVADVGEDTVFKAITDSLAVHNAYVRTMFDQFVEVTQDRQRASGGLDTMTMQALDEFGTPRAQKITAGQNLGLPLWLRGIAVQWTRTYFAGATVREVAAQFDAAKQADLRELLYRIKLAIFTPTNTTFVDSLIDNISLSVKALANADSFPLPIGPNGETFDAATEDHYIGEASYTAAFLSAALDTVAKKYSRTDMAIYINRAQETATRAFTDPPFLPYVDARIQISTATNAVAQPRLDNNDRNNRAIGFFDGAEVFVKPWVPANYVVIHNRAARKPLAFRERKPGSGDFRISFEDEIHPLRAKGFEREFGIGVQERTSMAVYYIANATYAAPSLAA